MNARELRKQVLYCIKNRESCSLDLSSEDKVTLVKLSCRLFSSFSVSTQEKAVLAGILSELNVGRPAGEWAQDIVLTKNNNQKKAA